MQAPTGSRFCVSMQSHSSWAILFLAGVLALDVVVNASTPVLRFRSDGTFKIVMVRSHGASNEFTDMHFGDDESDDAMTQEVQRTILNEEKPDLVVLGGDHVSGYAWGRRGGSSGWFRAQYAKAVAVMLELGYPWAMTIGNHDSEADLDRPAIAALDRSYPLSMTQETAKGVPGSTNYFLPVYGQSEATNSSILSRIYFFDSHRDYCQGVRGWGCALPSQVDWYRTHAQQLNSDQQIRPSIGFIHIPLPEMLQMFNNGPTYGTQGEWDGVCCSAMNTGLFSAIMRAQEIKMVLSGHDHTNDFIGDFHGVRLGYGRKTGYGGYFRLGWKHGARIIELSQSKDGEILFNTWIRQEDGSRDDQTQVHHPGLLSRKFATCCAYTQPMIWDVWFGDNSARNFFLVTLPTICCWTMVLALVGTASGRTVVGQGLFSARAWAYRKLQGKNKARLGTLHDDESKYTV